MTVEFQLHTAPTPAGIPATHELAVVPAKGDSVTFPDGSRWAVSEIVDDVRGSR